MLKIGTPKHTEDYVIIENDDMCYLLHKNNFIPSHRDDSGIYFKKTQQLITFLELNKEKEGDVN